MFTFSGGIHLPGRSRVLQPDRLLRATKMWEFNFSAFSLRICFENKNVRIHSIFPYVEFSLKVHFENNVIIHCFQVLEFSLRVHFERKNVTIALRIHSIFPHFHWESVLRPKCYKLPWEFPQCFCMLNFHRESVLRKNVTSCPENSLNFSACGIFIEIQNVTLIRWWLPLLRQRGGVLSRNPLIVIFSSSRVFEFLTSCKSRLIL